MGCQKSKLQKNDQKKMLVKSKSQPPQRFKLVLLGSSSVGKTSIATSYCMGALNKHFGPTIGGVYFKKDCKLQSGGQITINIWDTAGQEKYRSMASLYYRDADVAMLVFDLTDLTSFKQLEFWVSELDFRLEKNEMSVIVVGNKVDKEDRQVTRAEIKSWIQKHDGFEYKQVSAMTGEGVNAAFQLAAEIMCSKLLKK